MIRRPCIPVLLCLLFLYAGTAGLHAQPSGRSLGAEFSFTGIGLGFLMPSGGNTFHSISVEMDMPDVLRGETGIPGMRASYVTDFVFASADYGSFAVRWFAGPGFTAGYVRDIGSDFGFMAGICGNAGAEFSFKVPVSITLCVVPVIAAHATAGDTDMSLEIYRYGLLQAVSPRLGIRYCF